MFTTKSPSRPAPATDPRRRTATDTGLILVAHGDRGGEGDNGAVRAHAERLRNVMPVDTVEVGLLNGEPSFEKALQATQACRRVHVFPMLMSEGYFTDTAIPDRLRKLGQRGHEDRVVIHRPLGVLDALMRLTVQEARAGAQALGLTPQEVAVFLVGHGAKTNTRAREAIEMHARHVRGEGAFAKVLTGYLEEAPFLDDVARELDQPTVVVGLFISDGMHAGEDVPAAMTSATVPVFYTGALGSHEHVARIIVDEVSTEI